MGAEASFWRNDWFEQIDEATRMEVHARYALMGLFTLAVISAGFAFVYWLEAGGALGARVDYRIRFDGPVAGLSKGSAVLFNGIRVGEVRAMALDAASPRDVTIEIVADRTAPIRADTKVGIDFQGLAGSPAIALVGGSPSLPLLASAGTEARQLTAEKDAGLGMTQAARDVLRSLDTVVTENSAPLRSAIASIDKFAGALARNSDKVDGILAGLERLAGGGPKITPRIYELGAAQSFPPIASLPAGQMQIPEPTTLANLETDKILLGDSDTGRLDNAQWPDLLPRVVQAGLVRGFENAGYKRAFGRAPDGARADYQLLVEIRRFQVSKKPALQADVEVAARILRTDGTVTEARIFQAQAPLESLAPEQAAKSLTEAFAKVSVDLILWTCGTLQ